MNVFLILIAVLSNFSPKKDAIKIGFIGPMSGNAAANGEYTMRAFQMGVDDWNTNNDLQIEVIYEDGKCAPADAVTAANKLINVDKVNYIVTFCTGETMAVLPIIESNKIILLTSGTTAPNVKTGNYAFRNIGSTRTSLPILAPIVYDKTKKISLISENTDYAISSRDEFKKRYLALGGEIQFDESFDIKNSDFRTVILKLKEQNVDSVFVVMQTIDSSALLFKQMKEMDFYPQVFSTEGAINTNGLEKYSSGGFSDVVEGAILVEPFFDRENPKAKHLLDNYALKYENTKGPIPEHFLATHYDAVSLIGEATTKVGMNSKLVREYFLNNIKDWDGAIGKFSFDENGDAVVPMQVDIVKDGKIVKYNLQEN